MKITRESAGFTNALRCYIRACQCVLDKELWTNEEQKEWAERARYWLSVMKGYAFAEVSMAKLVREV
jgi:hypothetical protein